MNLTVSNFILQFFYCRMNQTYSSEYHYTKHHAGFKCYSPLKVHKVAGIIPQPSVHHSLNYITSQEFNPRSNCRTDNKNKYRILNPYQLKNPIYNEKAYSIYRDPWSKKKSPIYKTKFMIYPATPDGFINPAHQAIHQKAFHVITEPIPFFQLILFHHRHLIIIS